MTIGEGERFVMADIPGLIEGAAEGAGLGTRFLGHVERCVALVHLIDATGESATEAYRTVRAELEAYGGGLAEKPEIVALNKIDAMTPAEANRKRAALSRAIGKDVRLVSGVSGAGVRELVNEIAAMLRARRERGKAQHGSRRRAIGRRMKRGLPLAYAGMKIGLFGGSFDPAHEGHAHVAETALKRLGARPGVVAGVAAKSAEAEIEPFESASQSARKQAHGRKMVVTDLEAAARLRVHLSRRCAR